MKVYKLLALLIWATAVVILGSVVYFSFFYGNPPATYYNHPFPLDKKVYQTGDTIFITVDRCKYVDAPARVTMRLVNHGDDYVFPTQMRNSPPGCGVYTYPAITLPKGIISGIYRIEGMAEYLLSANITRTRRFATEFFSIEASTSSTSQAEEGKP
jgi:hypothetical protein